MSRFDLPDGKKGPADLMEVTLELGAELLVLAKSVRDDGCG